MVSNYERGREISEINMTPFVDIVLVILVIFMATATFVSQGRIPLSLPKASSSISSQDSHKPIIISLNANGDLFVDDVLMATEAFEKKLTDIQASKSKVILRSDAKTPFEKVVTVLDRCHANNIHEFAIQTIKVMP